MKLYLATPPPSTKCIELNPNTFRCHNARSPQVPAEWLPGGILGLNGVWLMAGSAASTAGVGRMDEQCDGDGDLDHIMTLQ